MFDRGCCFRCAGDLHGLFFIMMGVAVSTLRMHRQQHFYNDLRAKFDKRYIRHETHNATTSTSNEITILRDHNNGKRKRFVQIDSIDLIFTVPGVSLQRSNTVVQE